MIFRPIIQGALRGRETKFLYFLSFITIKIYFEQGAKKSQQSGAYTTAPRPMHLRVKADKYFTPNGKKLYVRLSAANWKPCSQGQMFREAN